MNTNRSTIHRCIAREKGFTMVEIIVVIAIMAIMMAISVPSFVDWRKNANYRKTANEITSIMREARSLAVSKGLQHQVVFNPTSKCYQLQSYNIATNSFNTASQTSCAPPDVTLRDSLDGTSTAVMTVIFKTNGTATISGGPEAPTSGNVSVNDSGTQKYLVTVMQTGRVSSKKKY
jgi:type II secretion system protein H